MYSNGTISTLNVKLSTATVQSLCTKWMRFCVTAYGEAAFSVTAFSALHGPHCLSQYFTWLAKPTLEKQTSQLNLVMQQCMRSV